MQEETQQEVLEREELEIITNRSFKGVWVPKNLYLEKKLSLREKFLLIEIDSLDRGEGCFATNKHLASFLGISEAALANMLTKLRRLKYIKDKKFDGRRRWLSVWWSGPSLGEKDVSQGEVPKMLRQGSQKCEGSQFYEGRVHNFVNEKEEKIPNGGLTTPLNSNSNSPSNTVSNTGVSISNSNTPIVPISNYRSLQYLQVLQDTEIEYFTKKYEISSKQVKKLAEDIVLYCTSRQKKYKNYKATLEVWIRKENKYPLREDRSHWIVKVPKKQKGDSGELSNQQ